MSILNVRTLTDPFGELWTAWTDDTAVKLLSDRSGASTITCFSQPVADSPVALDRDQSGRFYITYLDTDGTRLCKYSDRDGDTGSWASL